MNGQMSLFTSEVSTTSLFSPLDAFLSELSESIADGHSNATVIPSEDGQSQAAIDAVENAIASLGWVWNASAKQWERDGWLVWFRSQGNCGHPIAQWSRITKKSRADDDEESYTGARDPRNDRPNDWENEDENEAEDEALALTAPEPLPAVAPHIPKTDTRRLPYSGPFPRKRHYHRCPKCKEKGSNGVNCYKQRCTTPVLMSVPCSWCR